MPTQQPETKDVYLTLEALTTLDGIEFLKNNGSDVAISRGAFRSGPSKVKATLTAVALGAVLTTSNLASASVGPTLTQHQSSAAQVCSPIVAGLLAQIEKVERAHVDTVDYPRPEPMALRSAKAWAKRLPNACDATSWVAPSVAANTFGEVVFEWWNHSKTLALYFDDTDKIKFVKSPGKDLSDMTDGVVGENNQFSELFGWLQKRTG